MCPEATPERQAGRQFRSPREQGRAGNQGGGLLRLQNTQDRLCSRKEPWCAREGSAQGISPYLSEADVSWDCRLRSMSVRCVPLPVLGLKSEGLRSRRRKRIQRPFCLPPQTSTKGDLQELSVPFPVEPTHTGTQA